MGGSHEPPWPFTVAGKPPAALGHCLATVSRLSIHPFVRNPESAVDDIERGLLGILLAHPDRLRDVADLLRPEMFFYQCHQIIYEAIAGDASKGRTHTISTIEPRINDGLFSHTKEKRDYLAGLICCVVSPMQVRDYARSIVEFYNERRLRFIQSDASLSEMEKAEKIAYLWREIGNPSIAADTYSLGTMLDLTLENIENRYRAGGGLTGIQTGVSQLDRKLCGFEPGSLYVLAARPAMGKTALALTLAMNIARRKLPVLFFSLEMSWEQLAYRVNARFSSVNMWDQRTAENPNFIDLTDARNSLSDVPLTVFDRSGLTAEQICHKASDIASKVPQSLIVIDHLGIVAARDQRVPRVYQVAEMTMALKVLAKELKVPILLLHQLNRGVEGRDDKRPGLSDLRDSGSIEQDADVVMMLYREEYYLENREPPESATIAESQTWQRKMDAARGVADLIIVKNRQGEAGTVKLHFDAKRQAFEGLIK